MILLLLVVILLYYVILHYLYYPCSCCRNIIGALGEVIRLSGKQKKNLLLKMMSLKMTKIGSESGVSRPKKKKLSKKDRGGRNSGDGQLNIGGLRSLDNADQDLELARYDDL